MRPTAAIKEAVGFLKKAPQKTLAPGMVEHPV